MIKHFRINNQIRVPEVSLIDDEGKQLGVLKTFEALKLAQEKELDLVEVGPNVSPPIAKIMDYGKYIYRKQKQERKSSSKSKPKADERKTIRIGFKTGAHDLEFKAKQISEFLKEGSSVKVELTLRGREKALAEMGKERLNKFMVLLGEYTVIDPIKRSPFGWVTIIKQ